MLREFVLSPCQHVGPEVDILALQNISGLKDGLHAAKEGALVN